MHTITIADQHLYYRVVGTGSPLVLIHGFGSSSYVWQRILPHLAAQHQMFLIDLPGHGRSPLYGKWRLREIAPLLALWLQALNLPPVALLGTSMGGAIAIHLAAYVPELVSRLILVDAAGLPLHAQLPELTFRATRSFFQPGRGQYPLQLLLDAFQPRVRLWWECAQEMVISNFRQEIAMIMVPTLIIWGERDVLLPIRLGQQLRAALPHARFITLSHSGHLPMLAQPAAFSQIILDFLKV